MAKSQKNTPVTPNFKDVDKEATARAQASLQGGQQAPLKVPASAKVSMDKNGTQYSRWSEKMTVQSAYRSTAKSGLMDVTVIAKIRQSKDNDGAKVFSHYYLNLGTDVSDGHQTMNDRSMGALVSLLTATGYMPTGGTLRGSLLDKMFPSKGQPGSTSPIDGKSVVGSVVQQLGPQKDPKTRKVVTDADGEPILQKRDNVESYFPESVKEDDDDEDGS